MSENTSNVSIVLSGRIDSGNAAAVEQEVMRQLPSDSAAAVVMDMQDLAYISSAGLRVLLRVRKKNPDMRIINASPEVYDILEMTGFTDMMPVDRAYRVVSIEGCEEIGRGANGTIYRIDRDNVVKVYNNPSALEEIRHEREVAKLALILGIPTAISYDVVRVGGSYGSVFELLNASSFSKILSTQPEKMDWCVKEYIKLLEKIHGTLVPAGKLPDMKARVLDWAVFLQDYLPEDAARKLYRLIEEIPHDDHMLHGDYHTKNVELQGDEVLLIDMDTLAVGYPIFELAFMYNAFVGFTARDPSIIRKFQGFSAETGRTFWRKSLAAYLGTDNESVLDEVEKKAAVVGYARLLRREIRRGALDTEEGRAEVEFRKDRLLKLLEETDSLLFDPGEIELEAAVENLDRVQAFIEKRLEAEECSMRSQMQIALAAEEVFVNIASYAYAPGTGRARVRVETSGNPRMAVITFTDQGVPYNPLVNEDPDISLSAEERGVGGLGVFLTRKTMDDVSYEYRDGSNILTLKKKI